MGAIAAGELTRRITIQTVTPGQESTTGQDQPTVSDLCSVWAKVEAVRGAERWIQGGGQRIATDTMKFTIRYSKTVADLSPSLNQIAYRDKVFDIEAVDLLGPAGVPEGLVITATAKAV